MLVIQHALNDLVEKLHLEKTMMYDAMEEIMTGQATPAQIAGFLVALRMKGETTTEITAAVEVMRAFATKVIVDVHPLIDTCGTGGDGAGILNISTASAFVTATAGAYVAKHGNRSISSKSGSADVLEALGVNIDLTPEQVAQCITQINIGFLFAKHHHSAMRYATPVRQELKLRTLFNILGPLSNPANPKYQVIGIYNKEWLYRLAEVLKALGSQHIYLVHSEDGLDEISIAAPTYVVELKDGYIKEFVLTPEDVGLNTAVLESLKVNTAEESKEKLIEVFQGNESIAADMIALNAGAAIYTAGLTEDIQTGVKNAQQLLRSGKVYDKLQQLIHFTQAFRS